MKKWSGYIAAGCAVLFLALQPTAVSGAEVKAFVSIAVQGAVEALTGAFEKASGHKIVATWGAGASLGKRLQDGEAADLLISTRAGIDSLIKEGKIQAGSDTELARSVIGVAVRKGAPKPNISSTEAFKQALMSAKTISYSDPAVGGASGVHVGKVLERLGIAEAMKAKTKFPPPNGFSARLLVSGEADIAIQQVPELVSVDGIEIVGPLPADLQLVTTFVSGIPSTAKETDAAKAFVRFLQSPEAAGVMKAKGLEASKPMN